MVIFCGLTLFYMTSCLYFHYLGFKAGMKSGSSITPVQTDSGGV